MKKIVIILLGTGMSMIPFFTAHAQPIEMDWWTVAGGGGSSNAGSYILTGTVAQTGVGVLSAGYYSFTGGFWSLDFQRFLYLPLVIKN